MLDRSRTPSISVTIGRRECLYDAFITTAPAKLDLPATITLLADTLLELSCTRRTLSASTQPAAGTPLGSCSWTTFSPIGNAPNTRGTAIC